MNDKKFVYSDQAEALIASLVSFDREDFERWYMENMVLKIGGSFIVAYTVEKHQQMMHSEKKNTEGGK